MKISLDAGGYCADAKHQYGNYSFTDNFIKALLKYDNKNQYSLYSFCPAPQHLQLKDDWRYKLLRPRKLWLKIRVSIEETFYKHDIFLALNQAVPLYSRAKIISFSHGLSYYYFPQYYRESFIRLSLQLTPMIQKSQFIIVSSQKVKDEMKTVYPDYKNVIVNPFGIPFDMEDSIGMVKRNKKPYFLYVGMNHPIKNIKFLIKAFRKFNSHFGKNKYRLLLVGTLGMSFNRKDNIVVMPSINRSELKKLYQEATAYLTASLYESFNIPVLEALSQNCPVIGLKTAIIPEFKNYVKETENMDEFVDLMKIAVVDKRNINIHTLKKEFSWEKYIRKLLELYC